MIFSRTRWTASSQSKAVHELQVVFLCGARDFHAMDWYRASLEAIRHPRPVILTDLIEGEGFKKLLSDEDIVYKLIVLDRMLFRNQSRLGHVWRNILKAALFPLQVMLLRRFNSRHRNALYYAHSMYYIWLAWASGVRFVGTPQGSDILVKPQRSRIYRALSTLSMRAAKLITVDSRIMADAVRLLTGRRPMIAQNGIDLHAISTCKHSSSGFSSSRTLTTSFRGLTPLYRIDRLVRTRNASVANAQLALTFIYPFTDTDYADAIAPLLAARDRVLGRLSRDAMYQVFLATQLGISIPKSDSSPRSVYEAIFCGAVVAVSWQPYVEDLPTCMRARVIVVDLDDPNWLDDALQLAQTLLTASFTPSKEALETFDQATSFTRVHAEARKLI